MARKARVTTAIAARTMERRMGQVLREARQEKDGGRGWSRERVARASGVSVSTVCRYEVGGTPQNSRHLTAILAALGVTPEEAMARALELIALARSEGGHA